MEYSATGAPAVEKMGGGGVQVVSHGTSHAFASAHGQGRVRNAYRHEKGGGDYSHPPPTAHCSPRPPCSTRGRITLRTEQSRQLHPNHHNWQTNCRRMANLAHYWVLVSWSPNGAESRNRDHRPTTEQSLSNRHRYNVESILFP